MSSCFEQPDNTCIAVDFDERSVGNRGRCTRHGHDTGNPDFATVLAPRPDTQAALEDITDKRNESQ